MLHCNWMEFCPLNQCRKIVRASSVHFPDQLIHNISWRLLPILLCTEFPCVVFLYRRDLCRPCWLQQVLSPDLPPFWWKNIRKRQRQTLPVKLHIFTPRGELFWLLSHKFISTLPALAVTSCSLQSPHIWALHKKLCNSLSASYNSQDSSPFLCTWFAFFLLLYHRQHQQRGRIKFSAFRLFKVPWKSPGEIGPIAARVLVANQSAEQQILASLANSDDLNMQTFNFNWVSSWCCMCEPPALCVHRL